MLPADAMVAPPHLGTLIQQGSCGFLTPPCINPFQEVWLCYLGDYTTAVGCMRFPNLFLGSALSSTLGICNWCNRNVVGVQGSNQQFGDSEERGLQLYLCNLRVERFRL